MHPPMRDFVARLDAAGRLELIAQRIGFALWQFQELESASALCLVMLDKSARGIGVLAGNTLLRKAESKPFGAIVDALDRAKLLTPDFARRFDTLRKERNWLVHKSKADSRQAVHNDTSMRELIQRVDTMASEALVLLKALEKIAIRQATGAGVSKAYIEEEAKKLLSAWRSQDTYEK
jgi:hypothetical protein